MRLGIHQERDEDVPSDLLLDGLLSGLEEEIEENTAKVVRVRVGVSQLVGNSAQEEVATLGIQFHQQSLENVHGCGLSDRRRRGALGRRHSARVVLSSSVLGAILSYTAGRCCSIVVGS